MVTKHMVFPFYRNSWQTQCSDTPKYPWHKNLYSMKLKLGIPFLLCILPFIPPQYWCKKNVIIWNTPCHNNIIIWCPMSPHDAPVMSFPFWQQLMCMCLVCWVDTLTQSMEAKVDVLIHPSLSGKLWPQCIPWHSLSGTLMHPHVKPARIQFIKKISKI